jgi:HEAT repeats
MGSTQSPRVFERLEKALADEDADVRRAAVRGLALYGGDRAVAVLKRCAADEDLVRRESAVQALESLRQPLQAQWLQPLILAGKRYGYPTNDGPNPNEALRLLRMYAGDEAAPAMVSCLDFENPAVRSYYNYVILGALEATPGAPKATWNNDPNAEGTLQQIEENRKTLEKLRAWLVEHEKARRTEEGPMDKLAARLGDDDFEVRDKASRDLEAGGTMALPALLRAAALSGDAEVRTRARRVMDALWRRWKTQLPQG